jgi:hypothetical protein
MQLSLGVKSAFILLGNPHSVSMVHASIFGRLLERAVVGGDPILHSNNIEAAAVRGDSAPQSLLVMVDFFDDRIRGHAWPA